MTDLEPLSPGERQVLDLLAKGNTRADVARMLSKSFSTVATQLSRAQKKLGARNSLHAILVFAKQAWLEELGEGH